MKYLLLLIFSLTSGLVLAQDDVSWPPLPATAFITGRVAIESDVTAGRAVFVAKPAGKPLPIVIPQYAWHKDGSKRTPVIIIQAEDAGGRKAIGAIELSGQLLVGMLSEFELLGTSPPKATGRNAPEAK